MIVYTLLSLIAITKLYRTGIGRDQVSIEINITNKELENSKHATTSNIEFWLAREIQQILGYSEWRNFESVIERAKESCKGIDVPVNNHFVRSNKSARIRDDYTLSRYACYLIAMNGNTQKPEICAAQAYFAVQARRMEITDKALDVQERIQLRDRIKDSNKKLNDAAKNAGVLNYGAFHNAGYYGLYGKSKGETLKYKGLPKDADLLDRSGRAELAANDFRITQAELRIRNENVSNEAEAVKTHQTVGSEVREAMKKIGKTMPEDLPPEPSIKKLESQLKKSNQLISG